MRLDWLWLFVTTNTGVMLPKNLNESNLSFGLLLLRNGASDTIPIDGTGPVRAMISLFPNRLSIRKIKLMPLPSNRQPDLDLTAQSYRCS
jgi:hypothetical protein